MLQTMIITHRNIWYKISNSIMHSLFQLNAFQEWRKKKISIWKTIARLLTHVSEMVITMQSPGSSFTRSLSFATGCMFVKGLTYFWRHGKAMTRVLYINNGHVRLRAPTFNPFASARVGSAQTRGMGSQDVPTFKVHDDVMTWKRFRTTGSLRRESSDDHWIRFTKGW